MALIHGWHLIPDSLLVFHGFDVVYMAALMKDNDLPDSVLVFHGFDVVVHGSTDEGRGTWRH